MPLSSMFFGAIAGLSLIASCGASFTATGKTNVALYYGQGPSEASTGLLHFCQAANSPDIIPLGFIDYYVAQGNGFPGSNFGSSCGSAVYSGIGYNGVNNHKNDHLLSNCGVISSAIATCQGLGKKILLSLGGASNTYKLTSDGDATLMANFIWGAFGPYASSWTRPRPFDWNGKHTVVDGFDFDIEHTVAGEQKYYITLINRLKSLESTWKSANPSGKSFLYTASPQCVVKDANMGDIITGVKFDILFIQFYNTMACSARTWVNANPNYAKSRKEIESGFSYDSWVSAIAESPSKDAKIYIGLPGNSSAATSSNYYLGSSIKPLVQSYWCHKNFGGIMIWEAIYAEKNKDGNYYQSAKSVLNGFATGTSSINCATVTTTKIPATPTCGSGSCATSYTVKSGDTCYAIASSHGLTMAQFTALNPNWTNSTCPNLQIGTILCIKAGPACKRSLSGPMENEEPLQTPEVKLPRRHGHGHAHYHAHLHREKS